MSCQFVCSTGQKVNNNNMDNMNNESIHIKYKLIIWYTFSSQLFFMNVQWVLFIFLNPEYSFYHHRHIASRAHSRPWQKVAVQCNAQHPVGQEVPQDALRGRGASCEKWKQSKNGVLWRVLAPIFGLCPQLHTGVGGLPSMQEGLVEEQQMSTDPEGHRWRGGHESG